MEYENKKGAFPDLPVFDKLTFILIKQFPFIMAFVVIATCLLACSEPYGRLVTVVNEMWWMIWVVSVPLYFHTSLLGLLYNKKELGAFRALMVFLPGVNLIYIPFAYRRLPGVRPVFLWGLFLVFATVQVIALWEPVTTALAYIDMVLLVAQFILSLCLISGPYDYIHFHAYDAINPGPSIPLPPQYPKRLLITSLLAFAGAFAGIILTLSGIYLIGQVQLSMIEAEARKTGLVTSTNDYNWKYPSPEGPKAVDSFGKSNLVHFWLYSNLREESGMQGVIDPQAKAEWKVLFAENQKSWDIVTKAFLCDHFAETRTFRYSDEYLHAFRQQLALGTGIALEARLGELTSTELTQRTQWMQKMVSFSNEMEPMYFGTLMEDYFSFIQGVINHPQLTDETLMEQIRFFDDLELRAKGDLRRFIDEMTLECLESDLSPRVFGRFFRPKARFFYWRNVIPKMELPFDGEFFQVQEQLHKNVHEEDNHGLKKMANKYNSMLFRFSPAYYNMELAQYRARIRTSQVAMAVELFQRAHGKPPASLNELVPKYIKEIPNNPYTGAPLKYEQGDIEVTVLDITYRASTDPEKPMNFHVTSRTEKRLAAQVISDGEGEFADLYKENDDQIVFRIAIFKDKESLVNVR